MHRISSLILYARNKPVLSKFRFVSLRAKMTFKDVQSAEDKQALLRSFDTFLFDCDGVLWDGDDPIPGSIEAVNFLLSKNKQVLYITNNSSKSRTEYAKKFSKLGFTPVDAANIISSGSSAAYYAHKLLKQKNDKDKCVVFYVGLPALGEELARTGLEAICASDIAKPEKVTDWKYFKKNPSVGAVIVGADWNFDYAKATAAASYLVDPKVHFIGTNKDARLPTPNPEIITCGTGSIIKMVEMGAGREATYAGKPEGLMWDHVAFEFKDSNIDLSRTLMVGDSLNTDITFANSATPPIASLLVQTGNHKVHHVEKILTSPDPDLKSVPTFVAASLKDAIL